MVKTSDYDFFLPEELIAAYPSAVRGEDRLICYDRDDGVIRHNQFGDLISYLQPGDLLLFNDVRVRKSRLHGNKETGGKVEILLLSNNDEVIWNALLKSSRSVKLNQKIIIKDDLFCFLTEKNEGSFKLKFNRPLTKEILAEIGEVPLPPYIVKKRDENDNYQDDEKRYQTVYATEGDAVAAPTAGLHFTDDFMAKLDAKGIQMGYLTLTVGWGTFAPVKADKITDHVMHSESYFLSEKTVNLIEETKKNGKRVIGVGTTAVRTVESAFVDGKIKPGANNTDIFIYPGYNFKVIDGIVTNFHTPRSTLLMMVSAFAGRENIIKIYEEAVSEEYKFFSYGDAMLLT